MKTVPECYNEAATRHTHPTTWRCDKCLAEAFEEYHLDRLRSGLGDVPNNSEREIVDLMVRRQEVMREGHQAVILYSLEQAIIAKIYAVLSVLSYYRDMTGHLAHDTGAADAYRRGTEDGHKKGLEEGKKLCVRALVAMELEVRKAKDEFYDENEHAGVMRALEALETVGTDL